MGCPCREIRQVISHLPGVKHFLRLLPNLPNEGQSDMKMKTSPGRSIFVTSGNAYHADEHGIIHNVLGDDSHDLRTAGAEIYNEATAKAPATVGDPIPQKPLPPPEHAPTTSPQAVDKSSPKPAVDAAPDPAAPIKNEPAAP
jgi:hypothetical protein